jgi:hypothetical protein
MLPLHIGHATHVLSVMANHNVALNLAIRLRLAL